MYTKAYFKNIDEIIQGYLRQARSDIRVAVAWFTDIEFFNLLIELSHKNINIEIIIVDDEINSNSKIDFSLLGEAGGYVYKMNPLFSNLMHNKFCVIDDDIVISGSYNWTKKAKYNHESIVVFKGNSILAQDFIEEFRNLRDRTKSSPATGSDLDWSKTIRRLEAIRSLIILEDLDTFKSQLGKLRQEALDVSEITILADQLESQLLRGEIFNMTKTIDQFIGSRIAINVYQNPEILSLQLELKILNTHLQTLEDKKIEIEKLIITFRAKYNEVLSPIILKILEIKVKLANSKSEKDRAEEEFHAYENIINDIKRNPPKELTDEQTIELKQKFKQASKLCHPDIVAENDKEEATKVFIELKKAYDMNDLDSINTILTSLNLGLFNNNTLVKDDKITLIDEIARIKFRISHTKDEIDQINKSEIYLTIVNAGDWNLYFQNKSRELNEYYNKLVNVNV